MRMKRLRMRKHLLIAVCSLALLLSSPDVGDASAATKRTTAASPYSSGFFVDHYKNNISANMTVESNPVIGVLSEFNKLWTPGKTWNTGTKLNSRVLDANIQKVVDIAEHRTMLEENAAYFDDRRGQSYSVIDGLGKLADVYRMNAGATTTIISIPADASIKKYHDEGTDSGSTSSELGHVGVWSILYAATFLHRIRLKAISIIPVRFAGKTIRSLFQRLFPSSILIRTKTEVFQADIRTPHISALLLMLMRYRNVIKSC
ncbi:hypothetical protein CHCC14821_0258 [Bacillus paralicheniformis]|nr:hypothetical protein CHCC14821_0258 [Bacillus paralicheniformis]